MNVTSVTKFDESRAYRNTLSNFITGIVLITCLDADNNPFGITINSFSSVSLNPKIISWSLGKQNKYKNEFVSKNYLIQILHASQKDIAAQFSKTELSKNFNTELFQMYNNLPLLNNCLAWFECNLFAIHEVGDHILLLSKVVKFADNTNEEMQQENIALKPNSTPLSDSGLAFFRREIFGLNKN